MIQAARPQEPAAATMHQSFKFAGTTRQNTDKTNAVFFAGCILVRLLHPQYFAGCILVRLLHPQYLAMHIIGSAHWFGVWTIYMRIYWKLAT
jgi:hypothetical protein